MSDTVSKMRHIIGRERRTILDTVGTYEPARHQDIAIKLRQPGTGVWFTEGTLFTTWLATRKAKMWLYGIRKELPPPISLRY